MDGDETGRFVESTLVLPLPIFCSEPTSSSFSLFLFFMTPAITGNQIFADGFCLDALCTVSYVRSRYVENSEFSSRIV